MTEKHSFARKIDGGETQRQPGKKAAVSSFSTKLYLEYH